MPCKRTPDECEPVNPEEFTKLEFLPNRHRGIQFALEKLAEGEMLDHALQLQTLPQLTRRFVIRHAGGTPEFPFAFDQEVLVPKREYRDVARMMLLEGMTLRFGLRPAEGEREPRFNGRLLVCVGLAEGLTADFFLSESSWQPFSTADDLLIEDHELRGVKNPLPEAPFDDGQFQSMLDYLEPEMQDNSISPPNS